MSTSLSHTHKHTHTVAVGNWSNWGSGAAHVLPKLTSDRPLCSPRGERELGVASSSFTPPNPTISKEG
eukprot:scaffold502_cov350-Pavlova_lutheri.AAC.9